MCIVTHVVAIHDNFIYCLSHLIYIADTLTMTLSPSATMNNKVPLNITLRIDRKETRHVFIDPPEPA